MAYEKYKTRDPFTKSFAAFGQTQREIPKIKRDEFLKRMEDIKLAQDKIKTKTTDARSKVLQGREDTKWDYDVAKYEREKDALTQQDIKTADYYASLVKSGILSHNQAAERSPEYTKLYSGSEGEDFEKSISDKSSSKKRGIINYVDQRFRDEYGRFPDLKDPIDKAKTWEIAIRNYTEDELLNSPYNKPVKYVEDNIQTKGSSLPPKQFVPGEENFNDELSGLDAEVSGKDLMHSTSEQQYKLLYPDTTIEYKHLSKDKKKSVDEIVKYLIDEYGKEEKRRIVESDRAIAESKSKQKKGETNKDYRIRAADTEVSQVLKALRTGSKSKYYNLDKIVSKLKVKNKTIANTDIAREILDEGTMLQIYSDKFTDAELLAILKGRTPEGEAAPTMDNVNEFLRLYRLILAEMTKGDENVGFGSQK